MNAISATAISAISVRNLTLDRLDFKRRCADQVSGSLGESRGPSEAGPLDCLSLVLCVFFGDKIVYGCCWLSLVVGCCLFVISFLRWSSKGRNSLLCTSAAKAYDCRPCAWRTNDWDRPERVAIDLGSVAVDLGVFFSDVISFLRWSSKRRNSLLCTSAAKAYDCRPCAWRTNDWDRPERVAIDLGSVAVDLGVFFSDVISFLRWSSKRRNSLLCTSAAKAYDCRPCAWRTNDWDRPERVAIDLGSVAVDLGVFFSDVISFLRWSSKRRNSLLCTSAAKAYDCRPCAWRTNDWDRPERVAIDLGSVAVDLGVFFSDVISFLRWSSKRRNSLLCTSAAKAYDCRPCAWRTNDWDRPERVAIDLGSVAVDLGVFFSDVISFLRCRRRIRLWRLFTRAARPSAYSPWPRQIPSTVTLTNGKHASEATAFFLPLPCSLLLCFFAPLLSALLCLFSFGLCSFARG